MDKDISPKWFESQGKKGDIPNMMFRRSPLAISNTSKRHAIQKTQNLCNTYKKMHFQNVSVTGYDNTLGFIFLNRFYIFGNFLKIYNNSFYQLDINFLTAQTNPEKMEVSIPCIQSEKDFFSEIFSPNRRNCASKPPEQCIRDFFSKKYF